jgi:hypothetical protein
MIRKGDKMKDLLQTGKSNSIFLLAFILINIILAVTEDFSWKIFRVTVGVIAGLAIMYDIYLFNKALKGEKNGKKSTKNR